MSFNDKMKQYMQAGVKKSKELLAKAGAKAQELGEVGVLKLEISQLDTQLQKLYSKLGESVFNLAVTGTDTIDIQDQSLHQIIQEIQTVLDNRARKEEELKERELQKNAKST